MALGSGVATGQDYPNKPMHIVTSPPGGANDMQARTIAQGISGPLGQPVVVDNRPTVLTGEVVLKAPPDGYTLLGAASTFIYGHLLGEASYDPVRDFSPIILATMAPTILVVHSSLPVKTVKELIALAKAKPGVLNYGSSGAGASNHLGAELFNAMAGVKIVRIPYKGAGPLANALIGGQVDLALIPPASVLPHIKLGRLRALAVTSPQPSALVPGLPTVAASGLPSFETASLYSILAPAKTPEAIINRLNGEIVKVLRMAATKEKLLNSGIEIVGSSPEELASKMKFEIARMGKVIKDAGIRIE